MKDFTATIREGCAREADWIKVFGSREVILKSPLPHPAVLPGSDVAFVFDIDLKELLPDQRARLINHLAQRFNLPVAEVEEGLDREGCPILDEDVTITVDHPQRWF